MRSTRKTIIALVLATVSSIAHSATEGELSSALEEKYTYTKRSMLSGQVKKPGTVLYVKANGLQANKPSTVLKLTVIRNGNLEEIGGGSIIPGDSGYSLNVGEEMYLYSSRVKPGHVVMLLGTVKSHEMSVGGSRKLKPFQLGLRFEYDGGIASVSTGQILNDFAAYFSTEKELANADDNTLRLGQTPEQVIEILGPPKTKVDLGIKKMFNYDDMKVVFENGVVTDVQ